MCATYLQKVVKSWCNAANEGCSFQDKLVTLVGFFGVLRHRPTFSHLTQREDGTVWVLFDFATETEAEQR